MIISIRGTHGSGKSTVMRELIDKYCAQRYYGRAGKGRPEAYELALPGVHRTAYILGPYETTCGGCDAIQPYDLILELLTEYGAKGHVLFEGALVSSSYGRIGRLMEQWGQDGVMAFLNTPIDECLRRVVQRRVDRGDLRPFNPQNTIGKAKSGESTKRQIAEAGNIIRAVDLDWQEPVAQLLALLREGNDDGRVATVDSGTGSHPVAAGAEPAAPLDDRSLPGQLSFL